MISLGKITESSAAAGNFLSTYIFDLIDYVIFKKGVYYDLDQSLVNYTTSGPKVIGKNFAATISNTYHYTIPTYKVNEFGKANTG